MKSKLTKIKEKVRKVKTAKEDETQKRIVFPWLKNRTACRAKAYMAFLCDRKHDKFRKIGKMKPFFLKFIVPGVMKKFPKLYDVIAKHYNSKGRTMSHEHFVDLLYARFTNMYLRDLQKDGEHPLNSGSEELRKAYTEFIVSNQNNEPH